MTEELSEEHEGHRRFRLYRPHHRAIFLHAYDGAVAGMTVSGWIRSEDPDTYAQSIIIAGTYAQAVDHVFWEFAEEHRRDASRRAELRAQAEREGRLVEDEGIDLGPLVVSASELRIITQLAHLLFAGRAPSPTVGRRAAHFYERRTWLPNARAVHAVVVTSYEFLRQQVVPAPTPPEPEPAVMFGPDLQGDTASQRIVQVSGATLIPLVPQELGETEIAAWGLLVMDTDPTNEQNQFFAGLYLLGPEGGGEVTPTNWSIAGDGSNTVINAPEGGVSLSVGGVGTPPGGDGTIGIQLELLSNEVLVRPPVGGLEGPYNLKTDLVPMTPTSTTTLIGDQQASPSLTVTSVYGSAGYPLLSLQSDVTLEFGDVGGSVATALASAFYDLDLSNVTTNGYSFYVNNGGPLPGIDLAPYFADDPRLNIFRIKCVSAAVAAGA